MQRQHPKPRYCCGRIWLLSIAMLATAAAQAGPKERFRFEHLFQVDRVTDARIAPDGSQVAVVTERRKSDAYYSTQQTLWLVPREGGTPERLRTDDQNASLDKPIWSPDWRRLLYRISHEKTKELAILNLQSKQATTMQPCNEDETVGTATWSDRKGGGEECVSTCRSRWSP